MSVPARIGTYRSASGAGSGEPRIDVDDRCAPALASMTHWNPTGWHSAMFEPSMRMQSALSRSRGKLVAPPRPKLVPRPGTVAECHIRAWFSIWMAPRAANSSLMR